MDSTAPATRNPFVTAGPLDRLPTAPAERPHSLPPPTPGSGPSAVSGGRGSTRGWRRYGRHPQGTAARVVRVRPALLAPRPDVFAAPALLRGVHTGRVGAGDWADSPSWCFLAARGGAGAGLLSRLSHLPGDQEPPGGRAAAGWDADRLWPDPALQRGTGAVVVVARTTAAGLAAARDLAAQYLSGTAPAGTVLAGVVLVAEQPGKPPAPITRSISLLDGVYARTWQVPYVPEYRLLAPDALPAVHPLIADVLADIRAAVTELSAPTSTEGTLS